MLRAERLEPVEAEKTLHRIANSVTAMLLHLGLLESSVDDVETLPAADVREGLEHLRHDASKIREQLDRARQTPEVPDAVSLSQVVHRVLLDHPQVRWDRREVEAMVAGAGLVEEAVRHLIVNALEGDDRGRAREVALALEDEVFWVRVVVTDDGPGFAPETLTKAGMPFHTTKTGRLGLGLFTCRRVAALGGGSVEWSNLPNGGARVQLRLKKEISA
jgi:two-component system C4-dicarboxylate transport sensor histidine kinase DctB